MIGVFTAFTLSQAGMVRYWRRTRGAGWKRSAAINAARRHSRPASCSWSSCSTKFTQGAWLVIVAIPLLVLMFLGINRHYRRTSRRLRAGAAAIRASAAPRSTTLIAVDAIDDAAERAVWYAREIAGASFRAIHVPGRGTDAAIELRWRHWIGDRPRLELLPSDEGRIESLLEFVWSVPRGEADFVNVVVPELFHRRVTARGVPRPMSFQLKLRLLKEPGVVITDVPIVEGEPPVAERAVGRVLVSGVHGASLRAITYADNSRDRGCARRLFRLRCRRGPPHPAGLGAVRGRAPARRDRGAVSRPRRPATGISPGDHDGRHDCASSSCPSSSSTAGAGSFTTSERST